MFSEARSFFVKYPVFFFHLQKRGLCKGLCVDRSKSWLEHERVRPQWSLPRRGRSAKYQISKNHVGETQTMAAVNSFVLNSFTPLLRISLYNMTTVSFAARASLKTINSTCINKSSPRYWFFHVWRR